MPAAKLFTWIQGADFYINLHKEAVDALPEGDGKTWIDVGCGPGLVARLAASRGYKVIGVDADAAMIKAAKRIAKSKNSKVEFEIKSIFDLDDNTADVVSAASLLAVLPDKAKGLKKLWQAVKPGGYLLIIEPTSLMNRKNANKLIKSGLGGKRVSGLKLWARARENRTIIPDIFEQIDSAERKQLELLNGLVGAWIFKKVNKY